MLHELSDGNRCVLLAVLGELLWCSGTEAAIQQQAMLDDLGDVLLKWALGPAADDFDLSDGSVGDQYEH